MDYIQYLQKNFKNLTQRNRIKKLISDEIFLMERTIIQMQISQIDKGKGFDDKRLKSYSHRGRYKPSTADYAFLGKPTKPLAPKVKNEKYNFLWSGDFLSGFDMDKVADDFVLYSNGIGTDDKKKFFESYENMFGLDTINTQDVFEDVFSKVAIKLINEIYE